jgi:hypothetical protein
MCGCTCGTPAPPAAVVPAQFQWGAPAAPVAPVVNCAAGSSAVVLMDELGRPMANVAVQVTINGATNPQNTDNHGMIVFAATPAGTAVVLRLVDTHMAQAGESTNDASGRHFRLLGDGP